MYQPTIPSPPAGHNSEAPKARPPLRAEIAENVVGVLHAGRPNKADLLLVNLGDGVMVVKDFGRKRWRTRLLGRIQIAREVKAYEWLGSMPGVPRFLGRIDAHALALEKVDGEQLAFARSLHSEGASLIAKLRVLLDRLHAAGLVHLDLRGRENVLVRTDGELVVVDLAGAVRFRPGSLGHRLFFPLFAMTDEAAFLKWKLLLAPERLTDEERAFLRRFRFYRSLWVFNIRRDGGGGES